jgi:glycosyltransferase involved in cell wall biosynthesis
VGSTLVSVLVPVRDAEAYPDEALLSLGQQTHENLEVVVIDDGSRDASVDIARDWTLRDRRYVAAMGADHVARPRRFEVQLALLEEEGLDACGGGVAYFPMRRRGCGATRRTRPEDYLVLRLWAAGGRFGNAEEHVASRSPPSSRWTSASSGS